MDGNYNVAWNDLLEYEKPGSLLFQPKIRLNFPLCLQKGWVKNAIDFPGTPEINRESEKPLQGAKMTVMDILEFRDINGPAPKGEIWTN